MSCETETVQALRDAGHRLTPQRMMIIGILRHAREHLTAQEMHQRLRDEFPYVDISTVYRTLAALRDMRLITEIDMGLGDLRYEWAAAERHHHLICRGCGSTESVEHEYLENLGAEVFADRGFRVDLDHIALFGLCSGCVHASDPAQAAASAN